MHSSMDGAQRGEQKRIAHRTYNARDYLLALRESSCNVLSTLSLDIVPAYIQTCHRPLGGDMIAISVNSTAAEAFCATYIAWNQRGDDDCVFDAQTLARKVQLGFSLYVLDWKSKRVDGDSLHRPLGGVIIAVSINNSS